MKIFSYIIVLFIIFCNISFADELHFYTSPGHLEIKGKVQSILEKEVAVKGTRVDLIRRHVVSESLYEAISSDTLILRHHIYQGITTNYIYNSQFKIKEMSSIFTKSNKSSTKTIFHYDNSGKEIYELVYSSNGKLRDSIAVSFNESNNSVIKMHYDIEKNNIKSEEIWYNSKNKETKNIQQIGTMNTRIIYQYDEADDNIVEERWYLNGRLVQKVDYNYEDKYLIGKVEYDEADEISAKTVYEYDKISGLPISIKTGKHITSYEYNFDSNNNWIVKYEFYDDYPVKIIEREIKY